jgi:hypothetical protein
VTAQLDAVCALVEARLAGAPPAVARRLLRPQLRWVDERRGTREGDGLAERLGVVALVEGCRDELLGDRDADDGLALLLVDWRDVVHEVCERSRSADRVPRCPRCGERMPAEQLRGTEIRHRCRTCRIVRRC